MWIWFRGQFNKTITSVKILWGNLPQVIEFLPEDFQIHTEKENWQSLVRERLNGRQVEKMSKELAQGSFNFPLLIILICNALTAVAKEDTKLTQPARRLWEVSFFRQLLEAHPKPRWSQKRGRQQCWDVTSKLRGYNNIAKGRRETKGNKFSKAFQGFCLRL